eukprot:544011-Hanusia_phi.AAC.3
MSGFAICAVLCFGLWVYHSLPVRGECVTSLLIIRHGEKPMNASNPGLSFLGRARAAYLARCASSRTRALKYGPPTLLLAAKGNVSNGSSYRSHDTLLPLSKNLAVPLYSNVSKDDYSGFREMVHSAGCGDTILVAWEHFTIPHLVQALGVPNDDYFSEWPASCNSLHFQEPKQLETDSSCYDLIWQISIFVSHQNGQITRVPSYVTEFHQGTPLEFRQQGGREEGRRRLISCDRFRRARR